MKDYCKAIKTKNKHANENFKGSHAKFMAKVRNSRKEEWYTFKNKLLKPPIGSLYPKLTSLNIFFIGQQVREKSELVSNCDHCH